MSDIPVAKLLAFSRTAVCLDLVEFARDQNQRQMPRTILQNDRIDERSSRPVTSGRLSCDHNDATAALSRFRRVSGYPAMTASDQYLSKTWHLQSNFVFICRARAQYKLFILINLYNKFERLNK